MAKALEHAEGEPLKPGASDLPDNKLSYDFYPLDECVSSLQKEIRRGEEVNAFFWARQLALCGDDDRLWRRLKQIWLDDVNMAAPTLLLLLRQLEGMYSAYRKQRSQHAAMDCLGMTILLLSRAGKSNELRCFCNHMWHVEEEGYRPEVPAYAIDQHTKRGRKVRGSKVFKEQGCLLINRMGGNRYPDVTTGRKSLIEWTEGDEPVDETQDPGWTDEGYLPVPGKHSKY